MQADDGGWRVPAQGEQLIPGIPNEITLGDIAPKLPWRVFHILSSVSPAWLHAIRSHQVYNARARSENGSETLILIPLGRADTRIVIHLYSMRDNSCSRLPPIPNVRGGIPRYCQCVSLDGKIYVLGGRKESTPFYTSQPAAEVYVFDLAGQRRWMECARMKDPRDQFGCGVLDGKIYVFGGVSSSGPISRSEVYDPKDNIWSPLRPMMSLRVLHSVAAMGEELLVHNGGFHSQIGSLRNDPIEDRVSHLDHGDRQRTKIECAGGFCEVYHPVKDEWRLVKSSGMLGQSFMAQGKLRCIHRKEGIRVFDFAYSSWTHMHSVSFAPSGREEEVTLYLFHPVDDELLALAYSKKRKQCFLLRSTGLGSETKEVVFQQIQISSSGDPLLNYFHHESWHPFSIGLNWLSDIKL